MKEISEMTKYAIDRKITLPHKPVNFRLAYSSGKRSE